MRRKTNHFACLFDRRSFLLAGASASAALLARGVTLSAADKPTIPLAFVENGNQFTFDTGELRGVLRPDGLSRGLMPLVHVATGKPIARGHGVFSHYRLLDAEKRYGEGAWSWPSRARLLDDGAVAVVWPFDDSCPFTMQAVYRWADPQTLDLITTVTARRELRCFEAFLASYFDGFPASFVCVQESSLTAGRSGFLEAISERGVWQMAPRDEAAVRTIQDGRWQRPPHPVDWQILSRLAVPLAMRRDAESGLAALIMARPEDCFAVATPCGEESHRSLYLSLLGRNLRAGESCTARTRLVIRRGLSDADAIECYEAFCRL